MRLTPAARRSGALSLLLAVVISSAPARALVVNDDPALYETSDYDLVGFTNAVGGAGGVLVGSWFVLTAGHVTDFGLSGKTFTFDLDDGPVTYAWAEVIRHPTADLALVRLDRNTGLDGYELYTGTSEAGKTAILVGYGMSGTGTSVGAGGDPAYPRGTKRAGTNRLDAVVWYAGTRSLRLDFDANGTDVMLAEGDSGGASLLDVGGTLLLAGIHSSVDPADPEHWPTFGDVGYDVRVSHYASWIQGGIPDLGDLNDDGAIDAVDIDLLFDEIHVTGTPRLWPYDLTADDDVTTADADRLVLDILATRYGDANLDGRVNVLDLGALANHYRLPAGSWTDGDFNGDGVANILDLGLLANNYDVGGGGAPVPAPGPAGLLLLGAPVALRKRRRG